jgi:lipoprotein NlpD
LKRAALYLLGPLLGVFLAGCGNGPYPAPVREGSRSIRTLGVRIPAPAPAGYYRVQAGDTLFKIAFEKGLNYLDLAEWNQLADPDHIEVGALLRLNPPPAASASVAPPVVTTRSVAPAENVEVRPLPAEPTLPPPREDGTPKQWTWPCRGPLLSHFGEGLNKGIDIAGSRGEYVQAAARGKVAYTGAGLRGYGKLIIIRHGKTLLSAYAHNARILVKEGQVVARGQIISEMGDTDANRVKLHFEIREFGKPVDPLKYLPHLGQPRG